MRRALLWEPALCTKRNEVHTERANKFGGQIASSMHFATLNA
jgi:hypothetical protein